MYQVKRQLNNVYILAQKATVKTLETRFKSYQRGPLWADRGSKAKIAETIQVKKAHQSLTLSN